MYDSFLGRSFKSLNNHTIFFPFPSLSIVTQGHLEETSKLGFLNEDDVWWHLATPPNPTLGTGNGSEKLISAVLSHRELGGCLLLPHNQDHADWYNHQAQSTFFSLPPPRRAHSGL